MKKFDAVVIGDANIDLVVAGLNQFPQPGQETFVTNMTKHIGGGAALFAISLAKLGLRVAFNGVLGDDDYGRFILEKFTQYDIDTSLIQTSKTTQTGITIAINPETDRSFITYAGSNLELQIGQLNLSELAQGKHVHITGYRGRQNHEEFMSVAKTLKKMGITLSCDLGWDDSGEWFKGVFELMKHFDVFLMNETEALHYTGFDTIDESLRFMSDCCSHIVVKLGPQGAVTMKESVQTLHAAYPVETIDTTGAGDSFNAGYLFGYLSGQDVETCLRYGNACGALSVGAYGGSTGTPDLSKLEAFFLQFAKQKKDQLEAI
ncbi:ribokinase [Paenibacillus marchantiophytorum]|uniref:Ribokinase n=1 Tax=Paenibacillus marchantiophytorum TaxID=1619310 RepID=A0ABQ2BTD2_9BACL|nr:carbohydrate kinase family protein [Paenibacillus marchantiophytorum]GGI45296.1 ribokinase [Paenibacillus marchantiophytorum]